MASISQRRSNWIHDPITAGFRGADRLLISHPTVESHGLKRRAAKAAAAAAAAERRYQRWLARQQDDNTNDYYNDDDSDNDWNPPAPQVPSGEHPCLPGNIDGDGDGICAEE